MLAFSLIAILICSGLFALTLSSGNVAVGGCLGLLIMFFMFSACSALVVDKMTEDECPYKYTGCS